MFAKNSILKPINNNTQRAVISTLCKMRDILVNTLKNTLNYEKEEGGGVEIEGLVGWVGVEGGKMGINEVDEASRMLTSILGL